MTDNDDDDNVAGINFMESNPQEVAEAMYLLAANELLGSIAGKPWTTVFAGLPRNAQGGVLFMWAANLSVRVRQATERDEMVQYRELAICDGFLEHMRVDHADEPEAVSIVEWAIRLLTYSGEYDIPTARAIMGAAPDNSEEYGLWLGTLLGLWEQVTYSLVTYEEALAEAFGTNPVPTAWDENTERYGEAI